MYSHLRNINNLLEIIFLKYNVIEFFMIFKIIGDVSRWRYKYTNCNHFFVRKFQYDGKATPECLFEKGLCFNYCENRARYPVSTTFFCETNRLNINKHSNFVWLFNIWGCRGLIYLTKNGSENIIYARKYRSIAGTFSFARWRAVNLSPSHRLRPPLSLGQNDRMEELVISAARGHRTNTAIVRIATRRRSIFGTKWSQGGSCNICR